jgi:hypothetical protein
MGAAERAAVKGINSALNYIFIAELCANIAAMSFSVYIADRNRSSRVVKREQRSNIVVKRNDRMLWSNPSQTAVSGPLIKHSGQMHRQIHRGPEAPKIPNALLTTIRPLFDHTPIRSADPSRSNGGRMVVKVLVIKMRGGLAHEREREWRAHATHMRRADRRLVREGQAHPPGGGAAATYETH